MVSYSDYWLDLVKIAEEEGTSGDNNVNALLVYKELTAQIVTNASSFKDAGITSKQMQTQLDTAADVLANMKIVTGTANAEYEQEMKDSLETNIQLAKEIVLSTFNTGNLGGTTQGGESNAADTAAD